MFPTMNVSVISLVAIYSREERILSTATELMLPMWCEDLANFGVVAFLVTNQTRVLSCSASGI